MSPRKEMKYNWAKWYINPKPMIAPPIGIPTRGILKVTNAIRIAIKIGNGCGNIGRIDIPTPIAMAVKRKVTIFNAEDSRCCSNSSFSFLFCFWFWYQDRVPEIVKEGFFT
jgi:hypothetical protein